MGLPKLVTIWKGNHSVVHLENLKSVKVKECGKLRNLFSNALAQRLHTLEHLAILKCDSMEEIVSTDVAEAERGARGTKFSNVPPPMFFKNLEKITICKCNKMKSVLSLTIVQGLNQLKELAVVSCNQMEGIIALSDKERAAENQDLLPKLKILALQDLPKLDTVYNGKIALRWPSLEELQVRECPKLHKLPLASRSEPNLRKVRVQSAWFENLQCKDEYSKVRLQSLFTKE